MATLPRESAPRPTLGVWFFAPLTLVSWASAFVAIRVAVTELSAVSIVLGRFVVTAIFVTLLFAPRLRRAAWPRLSRRDVMALALIGLSGAVAYNLLLVHGQRTVSAFGASLLVNTVPIWTALLAAAVLRERLPPLAWFGVLVGFAGAAMVGGFEGGLRLELAGAVSVLLAAVAQAVYFVALRWVVPKVGAERTTVAIFWIATIALAPFFGTLLGELQSASSRAALAVLFLGLVPGGVGTWAWARSMALTEASRLAVLLYLVPPIAAVIAWRVLGDVPSVGVVLGGAVSLAGVALAGLARQRAHSIRDGDEVASC